MFELEGNAVTAGLNVELRRMVEEAGYGELWRKLQSYMEITPGGGFHWIFRVEGGPVAGNTKLAKRPRTPTAEDASTVQTLIETRGEGGWTVLAPSNGSTHPTGKPWTLVAGEPGVIPTLTLDEVTTLHRLARTFDEMPEMAAPAEPRMVARHPGELTPGNDYAVQTDWADILVPAGWTLVFTRGTVRYWRRPGKNVGISATTGYGDLGLDLLYIFTTSTEFESERSYSKLGAYAVMHHGGDYSAAVRDLRRQGYGGAAERDSPLTLIVGGSLAETGTDSSPPPELHPVPSAGSTAVTVLTPLAGGGEVADVSTWEPIDLAPFLDGSFVPDVPELLARTDGVMLLYRGRVHSFHGESESGKSWIALGAMATELAAGHACVMLDFESDAATVVGRLLRMGVPREAIRDHLHYLRPETSPQQLAREFTAWSKLLAGSYAVAVIDGVTEALSVFSVSSKDNDELTGWVRSVPRKLAAATGAAVIMVDHVTKDADSRGRFAIGGQAKMAALDGAAYLVEVIEPLGVGLVGRVALRVAKDRPGGVRPHSGSWRKGDRTQEAAVVTIDSSEDMVTTFSVEPPRDSLADAPGEVGFKNGVMMELMERVSIALENANACLTRTHLKKAVTGNSDRIIDALEWLVEEGHVIEDGPSINGGRPSARLLKPYRKP
jgi:hypothetical protein